MAWEFQMVLRREAIRQSNRNCSVLEEASGAYISYQETAKDSYSYFVAMQLISWLSLYDFYAMTADSCALTGKA